MSKVVRPMAWAALIFGALGGVAEYVHPGAGLYPAGVAMGSWLSAGWVWLCTEAE